MEGTGQNSPYHLDAYLPIGSITLYSPAHPRMACSGDIIGLRNEVGPGVVVLGFFLRPTWWVLDANFLQLFLWERFRAIFAMPCEFMVSESQLVDEVKEGYPIWGLEGKDGKSNLDDRGAEEAFITCNWWGRKFQFSAILLHPSRDPASTFFLQSNDTISLELRSNLPAGLQILLTTLRPITLPSKS